MKMFNLKSEEIRPVYPQSLHVVRLSWLTLLCNIVRTSHLEPLQWHTGMVVPIFQKWDKWVHSNYRGIALLNLPC